jgi:hypothetical protein
MFKKAYQIIFLLILISVKTASAQTQVWSSEAEDGELLGDAVLKTGCSNASGNFIQIGNTNGSGIKFSSVNIPSDGLYQLYINYFNATDQVMEIFVNDISIGNTNFIKSNFCYQGPSAQIMTNVNLKQGINIITLKVFNNTAAPFLDKLSIKSTSVINYAPLKYYISSTSGNDTNTGLTIDKPIKTVNQLNLKNLNPGDSVLFKASETFIGQFNVAGSGTIDKMIYIGRYGTGNDPILNGSTASGGDNLSAIYINNNEYIEIAHLEIVNNRIVSNPNVSDDLAFGINVLNDGNNVMHHLRFHDLNIHDIYAVSTNPDFNSIKVAGIYLYTAQNTVLGKEKNIRDVIVENCYIARTTRYGIQMGHAGGAANIGNDSLNRNMDMVFRNNHFFQTGGSGMLVSKAFNCLVENNIFEYSGSDYDPRMAKRGSGAWYFSSRNVISQFNKSYHIRGDGDSYGQHIDYGNKDIILQYNYSEDSEGGFVEILGNNVNSTYRFNVSVNDGFRDKKGNTFWISPFASPNNSSDSSYIYNNSVYVNANISPDMSLEGKNMFIYNNILYATGKGQIGSEILIKNDVGSKLYLSNNLYFGTVNSQFSKIDANPIFGNPVYINPGGLNNESYKLGIGSKALKVGKSFPEPKFPMAGKVVFKNISQFPNLDLFGNPVNIANSIPNIGADNLGANITTGINDFKIIDAASFSIYPNPVNDNVYININAHDKGILKLHLADLQGKILSSKEIVTTMGINKINFSIGQNISNGIYLLSIEENGNYISKKVVIVR